MSQEERIIQYLKIIGITIGLTGLFYALYLLHKIAYAYCLSPK